MPPKGYKLPQLPCVICGKPTRFRNQRRGMFAACSAECTAAGDRYLENLRCSKGHRVAFSERPGRAGEALRDLRAYLDDRAFSIEYAAAADDHCFSCSEGGRVLRRAQARDAAIADNRCIDCSAEASQTRCPRCESRYEATEAILDTVQALTDAADAGDFLAARATAFALVRAIESADPSTLAFPSGPNAEMALYEVFRAVEACYPDRAEQILARVHVT